MLPDTTTIEVRDGIVHWKNSEFQITVEEAEVIADELTEAYQQPGVDAVFVDNEAADGTWPQEVNEVWGGLMADMYAAEVDSATVCPSVTNKIHVNRLSRDNDTFDRIRAFEPSERDEARAFVGASE